MKVEVVIDEALLQDLCQKVINQIVNPAYGSSREEYDKLSAIVRKQIGDYLYGLNYADMVKEVAQQESRKLVTDAVRKYLRLQVTKEVKRQIEEESMFAAAE